MVEQVNKFTYLGNTISNDKRDKEGIIKDICQTKIPFINKKTLLTLKSIN